MVYKMSGDMECIIPVSQVFAHMDFEHVDRIDKLICSRLSLTIYLNDVEINYQLIINNKLLHNIICNMQCRLNCRFYAPQINNKIPYKHIISAIIIKLLLATPNTIISIMINKQSRSKQKLAGNSRYRHFDM